MAIVQVQKKSYRSTGPLTTHTVTPDTTPTAGHLLILVVVADDVVTTPAGWEIAVSSLDWVQEHIYYKTSAGNETSISFTLASSTTAAADFFQYSGMSASAQLDKTASNPTPGTVTDVATGTTATTAQADELLIGVIGCSVWGRDVSGWTNSFTEEFDAWTTGTGTIVNCATATRIVAATGAYTTTGTLSSSHSNPSAAIATFKSVGSTTPTGPATTGQGSQSSAATGTVNNPVVISVTEPVIEIVSSTNASTYDFGSFTPDPNCSLYVLALCRGTVATGSIVNVSGTSLTWTKKGSATFNAGADTAYCFWARTPASTAASVYRVDLTGDAATGCIAYMFCVANCDEVTADPIRQLATNSGTSANPTGTFAAARSTNSATLAAWMGALSSSNPANVSTAPAGWTEIGDNGFGTPTSNASAAYKETGETGTTVTFTAASTTWGFIAAEVRSTVDVIVGTTTTSQQSQSIASSGSVNASVSGTATSGQGLQSAAASGAETIAGTATTSQKSQSLLASTTIISGTATTAQGSQSAIASGSGSIIAGGITTGQKSQSASSAGIQTISGTSTTSQKSQSLLGGVQAITGTTATAQKSQSVIAAGTESIAGPATTSQKSQTVAVAAEVRPAQKVHWNDVVGWGEDGYRVKWGTSPGTYTQTADVGPNVLEYIIWGLTPNTVYYWIVVGLSAGAEQTPSAEATFNTFPQTVTTGQGSQSVASSGSVRITGTATSGQGSQSTVVVASEKITGTATSGQGSQSTVASGSTTATGAATTSQKSQSAIAAGGTPPVSGSITTGQGSQSALVAAQELLTGVTVVWQGTQSVLSTGSVAIAGTGATSQKSQSVLASVLVSAGAAATAQGTQNASGVGAGAGNSGVAATAQRSQSAVAAGAQMIAGTATSGQGGQSATAIGTETITGTAATSQKSQNVSGVGAGAAITGPATTSQAQSVTAVAYVLMTGIATTGQGLQSSSGSGAAPPIVGTASSAQRSQGVSSSGSVAIAGTSVTGQGSQRAQGTGLSWVEGAGATRQTQSAQASGSLVITGTASTGQGGQSTKAGVSSYREFDIVTEDGKSNIYSIIVAE